jgi:putative DNA methylase
LLSREKIKDDWGPGQSDCTWLATLNLMKRLDEDGELEAAILLRELGQSAAACRDLAYRCFAICEKRGWAQEATPFNSLIMAWPEIQKLALDRSNMAQGTLKV